MSANTEDISDKIDEQNLKLSKISNALKAIRENEKRIRQEVKNTVINNIIAALSVVAALVWKDSIQDFFKNVPFFNKDKWYGKIMFPVFITFLIVIASMLIKKYAVVKK
jgi:hypothetical protein